MGKVLSRFTNGFPGAISRSVDNIVISMRNRSGESIPYGAAVFLRANENSCLPFDASTSTADAFVGFTVREAVKTPDVYPSNASAFNADDVVEVMVRGCCVLQFAYDVTPGCNVYIRKSDGAFVSEAGGEGSTILLPNVTVHTVSDGDCRAEVVITKRNLM